ncbi:MAG: gluconate 2-dehydrogenase subunit 3 family protein, partial [Flavobacteriia bacterium]|nr:gluconate 2-dehydrogenase subunit 3 family protein [Flavobacteriia bacterium]
MNRRDSIRSLFLGSMAGGLALESCVTEPKQALEQKIWDYQYGRTPQEKAYDEKLLNQQFFTTSELDKIRRLGNLILPPNEAGSIEEAGVP